MLQVSQDQKGRLDLVERRSVVRTSVHCDIHVFVYIITDQPESVTDQLYYCLTLFLSQGDDGLTGPGGPKGIRVRVS